MIQAIMPQFMRKSAPTFGMVPRLNVQSKQPVLIPITFAGNRIKVMSYNVENFFDDKKDPVLQVDDTQWKKSPMEIKSLAAVILSENPDVIAMQEVENEAVLKDFNKKYLGGEYGNVVIFPTNDKRGIRVAFMAKDKFKVVDSKSHRAEMANGQPVFSRDFLEATFESPSGFRFTLFNTHFKSMKGGEDVTMPIRLQEARTGARIVNEKFKQDPNVKLMVLGDLNTLRNSVYGKPVLEAISGREDTDPTNDLTETTELKGRTFPTHYGRGKYPDSKLDYCYASKALVPHIEFSMPVGSFKMRPWKIASDHRPIVTVIDESPTPVKTRKPRNSKFRGVAFNSGAPRLQVMA